jgi:hypothetical protein
VIDDSSVPVITSREMLIIDLRTYGEEAVAAALRDADEEQISQITDRADYYVSRAEFATPSGASPLLSWALARAAVEIIEGEPRELRWRRRKLKGIYPGR